MTMSTYIEDSTSFELYQKRLANVISPSGSSNNHRQLKKEVRKSQKDEDSKEDKKEVDEVYENPAVKKQMKKTPPPPNESTQHGMMIDVGSQGTRLHVYEFEARVLKSPEEIHQAVRGLRLTFPTTDSRWTNRLTPGLDAFAYIDDDDKMITEVRNYLEPLLNFSKKLLIDKKQNWETYPIYLKATGGLRALPRPYRMRLIDTVRKILHNTTFNPFFFEDEHARVISGEEEAIYGWTAVNFVHGALIENSQGSGSVTKPESKTFGVLEMGGASAQIGFFEPNGDTMANLFKLQIGAAKHWNVYVHSFLYFGVNLAYDILNAELYTAATMQELDSNSSVTDSSIHNPCLPGGSQYLFSSRIHQMPNGTLLPLSSPNDPDVLEADLYSAIMSNDNGGGDYDKCSAIVHKLLRKEANAWCNFAHDRDCSFAGIYQPPLPIGKQNFGEFIATSNFFDVFDFLGISGQKVSMQQLLDKSRKICSMHFGDLIAYNNNRSKPISDMDDLNAMCFRSVFVSAFLIDGVGFDPNYSITAVDVINGQKLGWALGSMLYEINTLPWDFKKHKSGNGFKGLFQTSDSSELAELTGKLYYDRDYTGIVGLLTIVTLFATLKFLIPSKHDKHHGKGNPKGSCDDSESSSLIQSSTAFESYSQSS